MGLCGRATRIGLGGAVGRIVEGRADPVDGAGHHQPERTARGPARLAAAHPLHAQGRAGIAAQCNRVPGPPPARAGQGLRPRRDLRPGDVLRDVDGPAARVIRVRPAGRARTVHNIEVDATHAYYVATTTGTWTLAHNGCTDRIYSNRVLQRSAEKRIDPFHKFPYAFDE